MMYSVGFAVAEASRQRAAKQREDTHHVAATVAGPGPPASYLIR